MGFRKHHRLFSFILVMIVSLFISDFWLEKTWGARLWDSSTWGLIVKNLHFYSSLSIIVWIDLLAFKFLLVVEEDLFEIDEHTPYSHPLSKLKNNDLENIDSQKEIEKHEGKSIFYHKDTNKQNAVEKMINETSFKKGELDTKAGSYKQDGEKIFNDEMKIKVNKKEVSEDKAPAFLTQKPAESTEIPKISENQKPVKDTNYLITNEELLKNKNYYKIDVDVIADNKIEFFAIDDKNVFVAIKQENLNNILVDKKELGYDGNPKFWFAKDGRVESPVYKLNKIKRLLDKIIKEVLPATTKVKINPILILDNVSISNMNDAKNIFEENGITVYGSDKSEADFPLIENAMIKNLKEILPNFKEFIETLVKYISKKENKVE